MLIEERYQNKTIYKLISPWFIIIVFTIYFQLFTCRQRNVLDYQAGQDRLLCILPLFHIYGKVIIMMAGLASGATIVTLPKFDPEIFLSSIQKHKVNIITIIIIVVFFVVVVVVVIIFVVVAILCSSHLISTFCDQDVIDPALCVWPSSDSHVHKCCFPGSNRTYSSDKGWLFFAWNRFSWWWDCSHCWTAPIRSLLSWED